MVLRKLCQLFLARTRLLSGYELRTLSIVFQVEELVVPLRDNPQGIFDECANNEETSCSRYVSIPPNSPVSISIFSTFRSAHRADTGSPELYIEQCKQSPTRMEL